MRILVTNDDGIDSVGLHLLARAMTKHGDVTVVAPDSEYSGASAAFGALHLIKPEVHKVHLEGVERVFTVSGPPALCVFLARLGVFGEAPELVVAGINPGANVGRSVYHSGTIGAALTGRNGGIPVVKDGPQLGQVARAQKVADVTDSSRRQHRDGRRIDAQEGTAPGLERRHPPPVLSWRYEVVSGPVGRRSVKRNSAGC